MPKIFRLYVISSLVMLLFSPLLQAAPAVNLQTNMGSIVIELDQEKAPISVRNFINYVNAGYYNGTIFHRIIDNFVIQGGGYNENLQPKPTNPPIQNEAGNGLKNIRYSVAMARGNDPHSATTQFFINLVDNPFLDFRDARPRDWGYAVFGKVVQGMEVVDKIGKLGSHVEGMFQNMPNQAVVIESASVIDSAVQTQ